MNKWRGHDLTSRLSGNKACILKTFLPSQRTIPFLARESVFQCGSSSFVLSIIFLLAASGFHLFLSLVPHLLCTSSSSYSWTISAMLCSSRNSQLEGCGLLVCNFPLFYLALDVGVSQGMDLFLLTKLFSQPILSTTLV